MIHHPTGTEYHVQLDNLVPVNAVIPFQVQQMELHLHDQNLLNWFQSVVLSMIHLQFKFKQCACGILHSTIVPYGREHKAVGVAHEITSSKSQHQFSQMTMG